MEMLLWIWMMLRAQKRRKVRRSSNKMEKLKAKPKRARRSLSTWTSETTSHSSSTSTESSSKSNLNSASLRMLWDKSTRLWLTSLKESWMSPENSCSSLRRLHSHQRRLRPLSNYSSKENLLSMLLLKADSQLLSTWKEASDEWDLHLSSINETFKLLLNSIWLSYLEKNFNSNISLFYI
jgi:hypothetical protein